MRGPTLTSAREPVKQLPSEESLMSEAVTYIHLLPNSEPPEIASAPTRMVVVIATDVSQAWQAEISKWIVRSGVLYMMAWGHNCSSWDDSVDWANIDRYGDEPIPEEGFVVTTWHDDEPIDEVFWFAKNVATHPIKQLGRAIILDISTENRQTEMLCSFAAA